jgi:hypothetical protein
MKQDLIEGSEKGMPSHENPAVSGSGWMAALKTAFVTIGKIFCRGFVIQYLRRKTKAVGTTSETKIFIRRD